MPENKIAKIINIIFLSVLGLSVIFTVLYYAGGVTPESLGSTYEEKNYTELFLFWAYILVIVTVILAIGFPILKSILNPKNFKKLLIPIAAVVVVFVTALILASDAPMNITGLGLIDDRFTLKYSDMMIFTVYILLGGALIAIVYSSVAKLFKK